MMVYQNTRTETQLLKEIEQLQKDNKSLTDLEDHLNKRDKINREKIEQLQKDNTAKQEVIDKLEKVVEIVGIYFSQKEKNFNDDYRVLCKSDEAAKKVLKEYSQYCHKAKKEYKNRALINSKGEDE